MRLAAKALTVWLILIAAEVVHGTVRTLVLTPAVGDFRGRQIGVLTGSLLILAIATLSIRWIGARETPALLLIGSAWVVLTLTFELSVGLFVFGFSWARLASDYNVPEGGLLPFGMVVLLLAPLIAARAQRVQRGARPGRSND